MKGKVIIKITWNLKIIPVYNKTPKSVVMITVSLATLPFHVGGKQILAF